MRPTSEQWIKPSHTNANGGNCIEWAPAQTPRTGTVLVRDSEDRSGSTRAFRTTAWTAFIAGVQPGDFDA
ncbi:DUF397 domain-containing protein [Streptomyces sp. 796.1]|uniref:DUF397 domain-containing protein n=1 Tax=Streptomyces sp. 796.1 TaxID=3163029 RepID=UPI0039C97712